MRSRPLARHAPIAATFVLLALSLGAASSAPAVALAFVEEVVCDVTEPVCIMVVPDGSGPDFTQARTVDGQVVDATIAVQIWLVDETGWLYPLEGFWDWYLTLQAPDGQTTGCEQDHLMIADADTDADGWTTFSHAPRAGGWSQDLLEIWVVGDPASAMGSEIPPLPIWFNSPDLSGDLAIDLTDATLFAQDLAAPEAPFRSDLVWDGAIDLSDIVVFTQHLGAECP